MKEKTFEELSDREQNMQLFLMMQDITRRLEALEVKAGKGGVEIAGAPQFVKDFYNDRKKQEAK